MIWPEEAESKIKRAKKTKCLRLVHLLKLKSQFLDSFSCCAAPSEVSFTHCPLSAVAPLPQVAKLPIISLMKRKTLLIIA